MTEPDRSKPPTSFVLEVRVTPCYGTEAGDDPDPLNMWSSITCVDGALGDVGFVASELLKGLSDVFTEDQDDQAT